MDTNMETIKKKLIERDIRPTFQRMKIYDFLCGHHNHPNVDEIYEGIIKEMPSMSKTTVYNTIHTFVENGLVHEVLIKGTELRYDIRLENHHHFLCRECGAIFDVDIECCHFRAGMIEGHKIEQMHGYFIGICEKCLTKKPRS
jgi:Fur family peroxide stress response transcriptional regulator